MCVCVLVLKNLVDRLQFSQSIKSRNKNTQTHAQPMTYRGPRQSKNHFFLDSFNSAQGVAIRGDNMIHPDECIFMCFSTHSVLPYLSQFSAFRFGVRQQHTTTHSPVYCLLFTSLSTYTDSRREREDYLYIYLYSFRSHMSLLRLLLLLLLIIITHQFLVKAARMKRASSFVFIMYSFGKPRWTKRVRNHWQNRDVCENTN